MIENVGIVYQGSNGMQFMVKGSLRELSVYCFCWLLSSLQEIRLSIKSIRLYIFGECRPDFRFIYSQQNVPGVAFPS